MSLRIGIAGISHETNSYCPGLTRTDEFWILRGERISRLAGTSTDVGGMLAACDELDIEPVGLLVAGASPSGVISSDTYRALRDEILERLDAAGALDAVVLALHGAGIAEGVDDLEGDLAAAVRARLGPNVPLVATFDLHGNVTQAMAETLDLTLACHHYPHTDMDQRGAEAVGLLPDLVAGRLRTASHVESLPLLLPTSTTLFGPARRVLEACLEQERRDDIVDVSFFHGFPYTDTPLVGAHIVATAANGDRARAREAARAAARVLWDTREEFRPKSLSAEEAVARALEFDGEPIVINETSDNPGGGSPGDGTHLLRALLAAGPERACFGFICDAVTVAAAHSAGVGATLDVELGGRSDDLHGAPLRAAAYVKSLSDGRFTWQAMARGVPARLGKMARLVIDGVDVIVSSNRAQTLDAEPFLALGIDVTRYKLVALKSSNHFRAGFQDLAAEIITADPPGLTTHRIEVFPRERAPGPMWPLAEKASWESDA